MQISDADLQGFERKSPYPRKIESENNQSNLGVRGTVCIVQDAAVLVTIAFLI